MTNVPLRGNTICICAKKGAAAAESENKTVTDQARPARLHRCPDFVSQVQIKR